MLLLAAATTTTRGIYSAPITLIVYTTQQRPAIKVWVYWQIFAPEVWISLFLWLNCLALGLFLAISKDLEYIPQR